MFQLFMLFSIIFFYISFKLYHYFINPLSFYCFIWSVCAGLYQFGGIYFYPLSLTTWIYIILSLCFYSFGCILGKAVSQAIIIKSYNLTTSKKQKEKMTGFIIFLTFCSSIELYQRLIATIHKYGFYFYKYIKQIYQSQIHGTGITASFVVFEVFTYISIMLAGIYSYKNGFKKWLLWPILTSLLYQLCSGSRGTLIINIILFTAPFMFNHSDKSYLNSIEKLYITKKKKPIAAIAISVLTVLYVTIMRTSSSGNIVTKLQEALRNIIFYLASPIAVLNEFIKTGNQGIWGEHTFRIFRKYMYKLGIIPSYREPYSLGTYLTPEPSNVATYIGTLKYDFGYLGALFVIFMLGFIFSFYYCKLVKKYDISYQIIISVMSVVLGLSFFDWFFKSAIIWCCITMGLFFAICIKYRI